MTKQIVFFCISILGYLQSSATNYYFSNDGSDRNIGTSVHRPWANLSKINKVKLRPGDSILLKRGHVFIGSLKINASGTLNRPIVIGAYGEGNKPILSGAKLVTGWTTNGDVRSANVSQPITDLYVDGKRQTPARYPNKGFLYLDSGLQKRTLISSAISKIPGSPVGAFVRIRTIDWVYETRLCETSTANTIGLKYHGLYKEDRAIIPRTQGGLTTIYDLSKGYGFYLDGLPQFLDSVSEWSMRGKQLLWKPAYSADKGQKIEATTEREAIVLASSVKHIKINGLQIEKYFFSGISAGVNVENIEVSKCDIRQVNVFGIQMDSLSNKCVIRDNKIEDVLGKGISILEPQNMLIENNSVRRIGLVAGQGFSGINGASAISVNNHEWKTFLKSRYAIHNVVRNNRVDSCGYNGIRVDGSHSLVEMNLIENCGLTLNDGSALYCFAAQPGITHHQTFRRNIVRNSKGNNEATPANSIHFNGIYIDNNSHEIIVEENTAVGNSSTGLMNNDGSFNNTFRHNNVLDCKSGIGFYEWGRPGQNFGNKAYGNTIVAVRDSQRLVEDINYLSGKTNFADYHDNIYVHTISTNPFYKETKQIPLNSKLNLSFADWQAIGNQDRNSVAVLADNTLWKDYEPTLIVNESLEEKEYKFDKDTYRNSRGDLFNAPVKLGAFQSIIVLKRK